MLKHWLMARLQNRTTVRLSWRSYGAEIGLRRGVNYTQVAPKGATSAAFATPGHRHAPFASNEPLFSDSGAL